MMNKRRLEDLVQEHALGSKQQLSPENFIQSFRITEETSVLIDYLDEREQQRVKELTHTPRRHAYITSHALTRILLTLTLDRDMPPKSWKIDYNSRGKPSVSENIYFNISYAEDICIIAISTQGQIGIDITQSTPIENADLPWFVLHPQEIDLLQEIAPEKRYQRFLEMWTYKEAVAKAIGLGFDLEFNCINSTKIQMQYQELTLLITQQALSLGNKHYHYALAHIHTPQRIQNVS